jgi:hypothetical protein
MARRRAVRTRRWRDVRRRPPADEAIQVNQVGYHPRQQRSRPPVDVDRHRRRRRLRGAEGVPLVDDKTAASPSRARSPPAGPPPRARRCAGTDRREDRRFAMSSTT